MGNGRNEFNQWKRKPQQFGRHMAVCQWCKEPVVSGVSHQKCREAADKALDNLIPTRGRKPE